MKRIFIFVAMLTLAVGCSDLYGPEQTPITPDSAGGVEISISDVADRSFTVTVAPAEESAYYSYLVDESPVAEELNASSLYAKKYTGITQAAVKYSVSPSTTINVKGLKPNTTYQVYAVAGSPMGVVGDVVVKSVTTSDGVNPVLTDAAGADGVVQLTFSEAVTLGEGEMTLRYFARQTSQIEEDVEMGTYTVPAENISCSGNVVTATFEGKIHPGAYYTVDYPEGMFLDSAKNPAAALKSGFGLDEEGELVPYGVSGRMDFVSFDLVDTLNVSVFSDPAQLFVIPAVDAKIAKYGEGGASVVYSKGGRTVANPLVAKTDYILDYDAEGNVVVYMQLPEVPDYGAVVTVNFEEDAFCDIWGNSSNEFEASSLFSYGYTLDDVIGTYNAQVVNYNLQTGAQSLGKTTLVIEESDDPTAGNVMITNYFGLNCIVPVYADFDQDGGLLTIYEWQAFGMVQLAGQDTPEDDSDDVVGYLYHSSYNEEDLVFQMPEAGVLSGPSDAFGAYLYASADVQGYYTFWTNALAVKAEEAAPAASLNSAALLDAPKVKRAPVTGWK